MALNRVTAADCANIATVLAKHVERLGVRIPAGSELGAFIDDLRWLGSFEQAAPQPDTAWAIDKARAARAFPRYEQAVRIARALILADDSSEARLIPILSRWMKARSFD